MAGPGDLARAASGSPRAVEREAQLLASLNHSNVAGVYGLEESGGVNGDVMLGLSGESDGRNAECYQEPGGRLPRHADHTIEGLSGPSTLVCRRGKDRERARMLAIVTRNAAIIRLLI